jgi:hypothetical protein
MVLVGRGRGREYISTYRRTEKNVVARCSFSSAGVLSWCWLLDPFLLQA